MHEHGAGVGIGNQLEQPTAKEAQSLPREELADIFGDDPWELVRHEARVLGIPEEKHVATAKAAVESAMEQDPQFAEEIIQAQRHLRELVLSKLRSKS